MGRKTQQNSKTQEMTQHKDAESKAMHQELFAYFWSLAFVPSLNCKKFEVTFQRILVPLVPKYYHKIELYLDEDTTVLKMSSTNKWEQNRVQI